MTSRIRELKGKAIVDLRNGVKIGVFEDIMIAPDQLDSKVLVTNKGTVFNRRMEGIPIQDVRVWGKDVILVENQDVIRALDSFSDYQHWIMASDQLKQRYIVSIDGKRVGQLDDLVLDDRGRVSGISLGQVFVKGPLAQIKEIPTEAIRSLGPDVIIVDLDRVEIIGLMDEPELSPQDAQALHAPYVSGVSADREPAEVPYRERGVATAYADAYGAQIYDDHIPYRR